MACMTGYCLLCFENLSHALGWFSFLVKGEEQLICQECEQKFERIKGELCAICGRSLERLAPSHQEKGMCKDCLRWEEGPMRGALLQNRSLYVYDDWAKAVLARYKFRGDAILSEIFHKEIRQLYKHLPQSCRVIPVPLSSERQYERGFNQAELLAACLPYMKSPLITRVHTEKQSKKTRMERLQTQSPFLLSSRIQLEGEHILLVDDVYTTGTTLRQIGKVLREQGAAAVYALTVFRG